MDEANIRPKSRLKNSEDIKNHFIKEMDRNKLMIRSPKRFLQF